MSAILTLSRHIARIWPNKTPPKHRSSSKLDRPIRVLLIGIYAADQENYVADLTASFKGASKMSLEQRWVGLNGPPPDDRVAAVTVQTLSPYRPKWAIVNDLIKIEDLAIFDYFIVSDDDIRVSPDFLEKFIAEQESLDFALAQPARTWKSFTDHPIVRRRLFTRARETNFVESGPLVSFRNDLVGHLFPFDLDSPMGWGFDVIWPIVAQRLGFKIGIIDNVPVDHSLRPRGQLYDVSNQIHVMSTFLAKHDHVREQDMFKTFRIYR